MQVLINADDGDRIVVNAYQFSADEEEYVVSLRLDNCLGQAADGWDWITLTPQQARRFGRALLAAADGVGFPDEVLATN